MHIPKKEPDSLALILTYFLSCIVSAGRGNTRTVESQCQEIITWKVRIPGAIVCSDIFFFAFLVILPRSEVKIKTGRVAL